jgi:hypothetical protein
MSRLFQAWDRLLTRPAPPICLAVVRVLTGLFTLHYITAKGRWLGFVESQPASVFTPLGLTSHLSAPLPAEVTTALGIATTVMGVLFTLGLLWRVSGPVFGLLLLYTMTYRNSWTMIFHHENMLVIHVFILGLLPAAGRLALDPWLRRAWAGMRWLGAAPRQDPAPTWQTGWGLKMLQISATVPYVVAGVAKLRNSGLSWALGDNLREQVLMNGIFYELLRGGSGDITYTAVHWTWVWLPLSCASLALEFGAPLALLGGRWALGIVTSLIGLHWGILWIMGIYFDYQLCGVAFACFVPWDRLSLRGILPARGAASSHPPGSSADPPGPSSSG